MYLFLNVLLIICGILQTYYKCLSERMCVADVLRENIHFEESQQFEKFRK